MQRPRFGMLIGRRGRGHAVARHLPCASAPRCCGAMRKLVGPAHRTSRFLDADDQVRLIKQLIDAQDIDEKRWPPRQLAGLYRRAGRTAGLTPDKVPARRGACHAPTAEGGELYADYQARLQALNAADFGDLLLEVLRIFQEHPEVLAE